MDKLIKIVPDRIPLSDRVLCKLESEHKKMTDKPTVYIALTEAIADAIVSYWNTGDPPESDFPGAIEREYGDHFTDSLYKILQDAGFGNRTYMVRVCTSARIYTEVEVLASGPDDALEMVMDAFDIDFYVDPTCPTAENIHEPDVEIDSDVELVQEIGPNLIGG